MFLTLWRRKSIVTIMNEEKEKNNYRSEERMSERDKDRGRERKKKPKKKTFGGKEAACLENRGRFVEQKFLLSCSFWCDQSFLSI